jgi:hypothetical protein
MYHEQKSFFGQQSLSNRGAKGMHRYALELEYRARLKAVVLCFTAHSMMSLLPAVFSIHLLTRLSFDKLRHIRKPKKGHLQTQLAARMLGLEFVKFVKSPAFLFSR